jgi:uncharacterized membrane protein YidH (DUF202 family)
MNRAYYYLFYKFCHWAEWSITTTSKYWRATYSVSALELLLYISLRNYNIIYLNQNGGFKYFSFETLCVFLAIFLINYFIFLHKNRWVKYENEFNGLPKRKNIIGTVAIVGIVFFVCANLAFSSHLVHR